MFLCTHFVLVNLRHQLETPGTYSQLQAFYDERKGSLPSSRELSGDSLSATLSQPTATATSTTPPDGVISSTASEQLVPIMKVCMQNSAEQAVAAVKWVWEYLVPVYPQLQAFPYPQLSPSRNKKWQKSAIYFLLISLFINFRPHICTNFFFFLVPPRHALTFRLWKIEPVSLSASISLCQTCLQILTIQESQWDHSNFDCLRRESNFLASMRPVTAFCMCVCCIICT